jgi:Flp pilus assembly protein TadD
MRARAYLAAGELARARALAEHLLRARADDARTFGLLAQSQLRAGQSAQALAALGRALAADPFDPEATRLLAALEDPP